MTQVEPSQCAAAILGVDDMLAHLPLLGETLRGPGDVNFAAHYQAALAYAHIYKADSILFVIENSGTNGYTLCDAIKAGSFIHNAAIIFITADDGDFLQQQALSRGVDCSQKTLDITLTRARINTPLALEINTREQMAARSERAAVIANTRAFIGPWEASQANGFCDDINLETSFESPKSVQPFVNAPSQTQKSRITQPVAPNNFSVPRYCN